MLIVVEKQYGETITEINYNCRTYDLADSLFNRIYNNWRDNPRPNTIEVILKDDGGIIKKIQLPPTQTNIKKKFVRSGV